MAVLCAEESERKRVQRRIELAQALERFVMGDGPDDPYLDAVGSDSPRTLVDEVERHLRALLRDVMCGYLDADLRSVADGLLLDQPEPFEIRARRVQSPQSPAVPQSPGPRAEAEPVTAEAEPVTAEAEPVTAELEALEEARGSRGWRHRGRDAGVRRRPGELLGARVTHLTLGGEQLRDGRLMSIVPIIFCLVMFVGVVDGWYTVSGSGIAEHPYGKIYGGAPGAIGSASVMGLDESVDIHNWSRGTR